MQCKECVRRCIDGISVVYVIITNMVTVHKYMHMSRNQFNKYVRGMRSSP